MSQTYILKWGQELVWGLLVGIVAFIATELAATDFETLDPEALIVALAAGSGRVALAIVLNAVRALFSGS